MLSVAEAQNIVLQKARPLLPQTVPLAPPALGLILAEDVVSDLDMPPFDKAMMDGFALRSEDLVQGKGELSIIEEVSAGRTPTKPVNAGQATRIMTGAPIPQGADAVVMIERCEILSNNAVRIDESKVKPGMNILTQGREMRTGETVIKARTPLRPQVFGLLATVGRTEAKVYPPPQVAILATGDEIVPPQQKPGPGQFRNSNGAMLLAQVCRARGAPRMLDIARDEPNHLRTLILDGLQADVLLLSGGVSAGKLDLVPGILAELGVQVLFHRVSMKPGKPVLFGVLPRPDGNEPPRLIFGLPGNPVSSLVCFELFVRPAIAALMALPPGPDWVTAKLLEDYPYRSDRPTYHPAKLSSTQAGWSVEAVPWFGSPDLRGIGSANAFILLPEGDLVHRAGELFSVLRVEKE
jgi:molybdopterin molybdotransferase